MQRPSVQTNFSAGELSPRIQGFVDSEVYKAGLATLENGIVLPQGGVRKRNGTYYAATVKTSGARLIPMVFSTGNPFVLEFGNNYIRFYTNGGPITSGGSPYEVTTTYTTSELYGLTFINQNDILYIAHENHPPAMLSRITDTNWTLADVTFTDGPYNDVATYNRASSTATITASGTTGSVTLTASSALFASTDVGRMVRLQNVYQVQNVWSPGASVTSGQILLDTNGNIQKATTSGKTGSSAPTWNTTPDGLTTDNTVTWELTTANWGWGVISAYTDSKHVTLDVKSDLPTTDATSSWALGAWNSADGYPRIVSFHQERLIFGSSPQWPQTIWGSELGRYYSMAPSDLDSTVNADNAYSFTIASGRQDRVNWITSHKYMVCGTSEAEYMLQSSGPTVSPLDISIQLQTTIGSLPNIQPVELDYTIIFPQRGGVYLYEWRWEFQHYGFSGQPLNLDADHIFESGFTAFAYQRTPYKMLWGVTADGTLVSANRMGQTWGFSRHPMANCVVKDVCVIPTDTSDQVWIIAERTINGTTSQFVEYLYKPYDTTLNSAYYLDSGLDTKGVNATAQRTFTGLDHLDGATVTALGDGVVYSGLTVSAGSVTLPVAVKQCSIGLDYTMTLKTVPIAQPDAQGRIKAGIRAFVRLYDSAGVTVGTQAIPDTALYTGYVRGQMSPGYDKDVQLPITCSTALPANVLNAVVDYSIGDS